MRYLLIKVAVKDVVKVTENHGGFTAGTCSACKAHGWIDGYGLPWRMHKKVITTRLVHTKACPMNRHLNDDGSLK